MNIIIDKYYNGYEGEPEIQFIEELDEKSKNHLHMGWVF